MGRRRALDNAQARAVVSEARRGVKQVRIAKYFAVSAETVSNIVTGKTYSDVTGVADKGPCTCERCQQDDVRGDNIDRARGAQTEAECVGCHRITVVRVGVVLNARGLFRCDRCDGRKAVRR